MILGKSNIYMAKKSIGSQLNSCVQKIPSQKGSDVHKKDQTLDC